jgi:hypothetical protein
LQSSMRKLSLLLATAVLKTKNNINKIVFMPC